MMIVMHRLWCLTSELPSMNWCISDTILVGGLEHFLFFHILRINDDNLDQWQHHTTKNRYPAVIKHGLLENGASIDDNPIESSIHSGFPASHV